MDIKLTGEMDGREAARLIREKHDIPVVFVTAHNDQTIIEEGYIRVDKPFTKEEIWKAVEDALNRAPPPSHQS
jgi:two-component system response regulator